MEEEEEKKYLAVRFYKELHGMMPTSVMPILASITHHVKNITLTGTCLSCSWGH